MNTDDERLFEILKEKDAKRIKYSKDYYKQNREVIRERHERGRYSRMTEEEKARRKARTREWYRNNRARVLEEKKNQYAAKKKEVEV